MNTRKDKNQERTLKKRALQLDLEALKHEINDTPDQDLIVGVLQDYLDQLQELKKRRSQIQALDPQELVMDDIQDVIEDDDGGLTTAAFSVPQWLIFKKRLLLRKRELCETQNRKTEMRQKIMIQDTLRVSSKQKIQPLENRRLLLPWQSDYSKLKKQFKNLNLPDWKSELLKLAKQSLRMKVDVESCA